MFCRLHTLEEWLQSRRDGRSTEGDEVSQSLVRSGGNQSTDGWCVPPATTATARSNATRCRCPSRGRRGKAVVMPDRRLLRVGVAGKPEVLDTACARIREVGLGNEKA